MVITVLGEVGHYVFQFFLPVMGFILTFKVSIPAGILLSPIVGYGLTYVGMEQLWSIHRWAFFLFLILISPPLIYAESFSVGLARKFTLGFTLLGSISYWLIIAYLDVVYFVTLIIVNLEGESRET